MIELSGSGSSDPDGDALDFAWDLDDDGTFESPGQSVSRTFADDGSYTVRLRVTDSHGATDTETAQVTVYNVSPTVAPLHRAGWSAVRAMVPRDGAQRLMDELFDIGARGILLTDIHACRL